jgi:hypothetical protein
MAVERSGRFGGGRCQGPVNGGRVVVSVERVSRNERMPGDWLVLKEGSGEGSALQSHGG